jgi:DNA polymerase-4
MAAYNSPRGCILAPSIEAKRLGIKTGMRVMEARLICKDVIVRTTDTVLVRDVHVRLKKICRDYSVSVTPKSIDEVVIDFNPMERSLKRPLTDIAQEIKDRLRKEIGEWISASVGIGTNRFLAKTGASLHKPDGLDVITHENLREIYSRLKLIDLCGISTRFEARLNMHGIFTPLQFLDASPTLLKYQVFQSICGYYWYKRLRGWEVDAIDFERKSYGQDYALAKQTADPAELSKIIMKLCEKMGRRLRNSGKAAQGIHVAFLYKDYTSWHRGRMMSEEMYSTSELYRGAQLIFNQQPERKVIAKLSVSCYGLSPSSKSQMSLFEQDTSKSRKVSDALDQINNRYGEFVITPALMLGMDNTVVDRIAFGGVKELEEIYTH